MSSAICFNLDQSKILSSGNRLTRYHTITTFNNMGKKPFENIVGKGFEFGHPQNCFSKWQLKQF